MKKIFALLLAATMAVAMFACGNGDDVTSADTTTVEEVTTTETTKATDGTAATIVVTDATEATTKATEATTAATTSTTATAATTATTATPIVPENKYVVDPYAHITFKDGAVTDLKGNTALEIKTANGATAASVADTQVTFGGKTKTVSALHIGNVGTWVKGTLTQFEGASDFDAHIASTGGWSVEAFYLDNSTTNAVRGIVCVTEANSGDKKRSGWGLAEDASGKPYFITGHTDANAYSSAYAKSAASTTELVHVVGVYNGTAKTVSIYVNGVLSESKAAAGAFTSADKVEKFEGFNMANAFYIGNDPTVQNKPNGDFPADDLTVVDVKLYDKALSANDVKAIYDAVAADFN